MDQFAEWDRFMEVMERSRTTDRAFKTYKRERNAEELGRYERDLKRDKAEEEKAKR